MANDFRAVRRGRRVLLVDESLDAQAAERMADSIVEVTSARQLTSSGAWRGRSGKLSVVRARLGGRWVVVRRFTHGGLLAGVLPEITLGRRRITHEIEIVNMARRCGVPTPRIVAAALQRSPAWAGRLGPFYRAHVITEEVEGARNMTEFFLHLPVLDPESAARQKRAALESVAKAIASMHAANILHGDLHLRNILARVKGRGAQAYIIDFDRARLVSRMTPSARLNNLKRLMRSVWKVQPVRELFSTRDALRFLRAYLGESDRRVVARWAKALARRPWLRELGWAAQRSAGQTPGPSTERADDAG